MSQDLVSAKVGRATVWSTAFNLVSTIVGVGILTVPEAVKEGGIGASLLMFALVALAVSHTSNLMVRTADAVGVNSYEELATRVLGKGGYLLLCTMCVFLNAGAVLSYVVAMLGCIQHEVAPHLDVRIVVALICVCVCLPLSLMPDWESVAVLSKMKIGVFVLITLFIIVKGFLDIDNNPPDFEAGNFSEFIADRETWIGSKAYKGIGTILFSLVCHDFVFPLKNSMRDNSVSAFGKAVSSGLLLALAFNVTVGISSFLIFREKLPDNVLTSNTKNHVFRFDGWFFAARLLLIVVMALTLPLCVAVSREYAVSLYKLFVEHFGLEDSKSESEVQTTIDESATSMDSMAGQCHGLNVQTEADATQETIQQKETEQSKDNAVLAFLKTHFGMSKLEYVMTLLSFAVPVLCGLTMGTSLETVVDTMGSYCSGCIGFILPGLIYVHFAQESLYGSFWQLIRPQPAATDVESADGCAKPRLTTTERLYAIADLSVAFLIAVVGVGLWINQTLVLCGVL